MISTTTYIHQRIRVWTHSAVNIRGTRPVDVLCFSKYYLNGANTKLCLKKRQIAFKFKCLDFLPIPRSTSALLMMYNKWLYYMSPLCIIIMFYY